MVFNEKKMRENLVRYQHVVERIRKLSGAPGLAISIYHHSQNIYEDYCGVRDVEGSLPVNKDTIFHVASLTKAITAIAVGILVDRGELEWNTPMEAVLPFFKENQSEKSKLSLVDLLSHRSGTTWGDALYLQSNNNIMLPKSESLRTFQYLPTVSAPRSQYLYNNHTYNLPGFIIETLSRQSYATFLKENIFSPLEITRTSISAPNDSNVAVLYNILSDDTLFKIPFSEISNDTMMFSGISMRTSMADIMRLYQAILDTINPLVPPLEEETNSSTGLFDKFCGLVGWCGSTPANANRAQPQEPAAIESPIKQSIQLFRSYVRRGNDTLYEQISALGWSRTQLPGKLELGWDSSNVGTMPLFGRNYSRKLAIWHGGNMPGTTAATILLPETKMVIVVLQNSLGLCDVADLTAQLLLDCLFTGSPQHDYVSLAMEPTRNGTARMEQVAKRLEHEREPGTNHKPLKEYVGTYENAIKNWIIEIGLDDHNQLFLRLQGRVDEEYSLRHYHYDIFVRNLSYDEVVKRAQYCRAYAFYRFHFESQNDQINFLRWHHDLSVPEGEVFVSCKE